MIISICTQFVDLGSRLLSKSRHWQLMQISLTFCYCYSLWYLTVISQTVITDTEYELT